MEPGSLALQADSLPVEPREAHSYMVLQQWPPNMKLILHMDVQFIYGCVCVCVCGGGYTGLLTLASKLSPCFTSLFLQWFYLISNYYKDKIGKS